MSEIDGIWLRVLLCLVLVQVTNGWVAVIWSIAAIIGMVYIGLMHVLDWLERREARQHGRR